jgi:hypothetical protein
MLQSFEGLVKGTLRRGIVENRAGETATGRTDTSAALAMLSVFASVGAKVFDLSITDLADGKPVKGMQRPGRSLEEIRGRIARDLQDAERNRQNVIIRPRSTTALLIQLDDCDDEKAERLEPFSFLTLRTSPSNGQVWLAVSDGPQESTAAATEFKTRVRRGAGADHSATGATRIAGSLNFKSKYAPAFPRVEITRANAGSFTTVAALENAGLVAPDEPQPPAVFPAPFPTPRPAPARKWPDYQTALRGARQNKDGNGPDRSTADFMWCKWAAERGWTERDIAAKLAEVSEKARQRIAAGDKENQQRGLPGYCLLTARNGVSAVERERGRRQVLKSTASPR